MFEMVLNSPFALNLLGYTERTVWWEEEHFLWIIVSDIKIEFWTLNISRTASFEIPLVHLSNRHQVFSPSLGH